MRTISDNQPLIDDAVDKAVRIPMTGIVRELLED